MEPEDFLVLATLLATGTPNPAKLRTATSRAYYGVHHIGSKALTDVGIKISRGPAAHGEVFNKLQVSGDPDLEAAGSQLADLHSYRIKADYRLEDLRTEKPQNVRGHIEQAKKIVDTIRDVWSIPSKKQAISRAIKDWEISTGNRS